MRRSYSVIKTVLLLLLVCSSFTFAQSGAHAVKFRVVAMAETVQGDHQGFVDAAKQYLSKLAAENDFAVDYISSTDPIDEAFLAKYRLFIQLNYHPIDGRPLRKRPSRITSRTARVDG